MFRINNFGIVNHFIGALVKRNGSGKPCKDHEKLRSLTQTSSTRVNISFLGRSKNEKGETFVREPSSSCGVNAVEGDSEGVDDPFTSPAPLSAAEEKGANLASRAEAEGTVWDFIFKCLVRRNRREAGARRAGGRGGEQGRPPQPPQPPRGRGRRGGERVGWMSVKRQYTL